MEWRSVAAPSPRRIRHCKKNLAMSLESEIIHAINCNNAEAPSNTPDFIHGQYLLNCLAAFNTAVQQRETWYGRDARPCEQSQTPTSYIKAPFEIIGYGDEPFQKQFEEPMKFTPDETR
jgi:hypothetical protein